MLHGCALRQEGIQGQEPFDIRHAQADAGTLVMPTAPTAVYNVVSDLESFDPAEVHISVYALYIPYETQASTGIPEAPVAPGAPWKMRAGTPSGHIMIVPTAQ